MGRKRKRGREAVQSTATAESAAAFIDHHQNSAVDPYILASPHLRQNRGAFLRCGIQTNVPRELRHGDCPRFPYRRREAEPKSSVHWGQRKLLISEIEFLSDFGGKSCEPIDSTICCIYLGAAPGTHIPFLSSLFPHIEFILIDPSSFSIGDTSNISIRNEFASPELCSAYRGHKGILLCISDIRTADWRIMDAATVERSVACDMDLQQDCILAMKPTAAMLKFRLPYTEIGVKKYLDGKICFPVWSPQTTTESRLVVTSSADGFRFRNWCIQTYNEEMFYFNTITRQAIYDHDVIVHGLDYCYDCAAEVQVLRRFVQRPDNVAAQQTERVSLAVGKLVKKLSAACSSSGKRDLLNWYSNNNYEFKVYDVRTNTLAVVDESHVVAETSSPETAHDICMTAWRSKHASLVQGLADANWHCLQEDDLLLDTRATGRAALAFGVNGFGYDVPPESPLGLWVWAVIYQLANNIPGGYGGTDGTETECDRELIAEQQLQESSKATTRVEMLMSFGLMSIENSSQPFTVCSNCAYSGGSCVGSCRENVLVLFCRSGCAFIIWPDQTLTKLCNFPTASLQHATIAVGFVDMIYFTQPTFDPNAGARNVSQMVHYSCCRKFYLSAIHAINGRICCANDRDNVCNFLNTELNFQDDYENRENEAISGGSEPLTKMSSPVENSVHSTSRSIVTTSAVVLHHSGLHAVDVSSALLP